MFRILDGRTYFFQWDTEQKLEVMDYDITEVHFSNQVSEKALVCEVKQQDGKRVVDVPNILLQETWDIKVYACCDCYTRGATIYEVKAKEKPDDYVYTETEVKRFDDLEERLETVEDRVETVENKAAATENKVETVEDKLETVEDKVEALEKNSGGNKYKYIGTYTVSSNKASETIKYVNGKQINYKKVLIVADVKGKNGPNGTVSSASLKVVFQFNEMEDLEILVSGALYNEQVRNVYIECLGSDEMYRTIWTASSTNTAKALYTSVDRRESDEKIKGIQISSSAPTTMYIAAGTILKIYAVE